MAFSTSGIVVIGTDVIECEQITYQPNTTNESINSGGFNSPINVVGVGGKPVFSFTTKNVAAVLGYSFLVNSIATNAVNIYCQTVENGGTTNGKATKYALSAGVFVIDSISMSMGSVATATVSCYPSSTTGFASPVAITDESTDLPSYTKNDEWLLVGTASINGTAIAKSTNIELTLGHSVTQQTTVGGYYPQDCFVTGYAPVMTISTHDAKTARTLLTEQGKQLASGGCVVSLYSVNASGVLTNTAAKTLTIASGFAHINDRQYSQGNVNETQIIVTASYDNSNAAIEVA